ncbi:hypothetical protein Psi02_30990 [Planotetraspora silvatica]|uniref:Uncharacterized protein n=1 Tax=Planotetraspora silvatica TaxID=234614 RepID=A0A8J3ULK4_9ACTN|nr:hypothetical protein Psi02_30990 [Planotetraspora silvatica]
MPDRKGVRQSCLGGGRTCAHLVSEGRKGPFMASGNASGMTGTTVNLTMGSLDDQGPFEKPGR